MKPKTRTRVRLRHFASGMSITSAWTVECCLNRKWLPLAGENGVDKFESKEAAHKRADELQQLDFTP